MEVWMKQCSSKEFWQGPQWILKPKSPMKGDHLLQEQAALASLPPSVTGREHPGKCSLCTRTATGVRGCHWSGHLYFLQLEIWQAHSHDHHTGCVLACLNLCYLFIHCYWLQVKTLPPIAVEARDYPKFTARTGPENLTFLFHTTT